MCGWGAGGAGTSTRATVSPTALRGVHVFGWGFTGPTAIAADGTHVWVANGDDESVVELNASTGRFVRVIVGHRYELFGPEAIASDGTHIWVANPGSSPTVTIKKWVVLLR